MSRTKALILTTVAATLLLATLHALVLVYLASSMVSKVVEREQQRFGAFVHRAISEHFGEDLFQRLREEGRRDQTVADLLGILNPYGGFRVKVHDQNGVILWSDESRLRGRVFPDNYLLNRALAGEIVSKLEKPIRSEHVYERQLAAYVTEVYVPIFSKAGRLQGVVEVYRQADEMAADISRVRRVIWVGAAVATAILCAALAMIMGFGQKRILGLQREIRDREVQVFHQEKMAALGRLAAGIAHEVGNPLSSISAVLQKMLRGSRGEQSDLNVMQTQVERINRIVRSVGTLARPSPETQQTLDLSSVVTKALRAMELDHRWKSYEVTTDLAPSPLLVQGNADQLMQVFLNILLNAVDAMGPSGKIRIQTSERGSVVEAAVADSGPGIPRSVRNRLFEPFVTTKPAGQGTGLGLHLSWNIVASHGGKISVAENKTHGTIFSVTLPAASSSEVPRASMRDRRESGPAGQPQP